MEHKFYTDNFERLLREQTDNFKMQPSKKVWQGIYNNVHPSRRLPSILMSLVLITSLLLLGYLNTRNSKPAPALLADAAGKNGSTPASANATPTAANNNINIASPGAAAPAGNQPITLNGNNSNTRNVPVININRNNNFVSRNNNRNNRNNKSGTAPVIPFTTAVNNNTISNTPAAPADALLAAAAERPVTVADNLSPVSSVVMRAGVVPGKSSAAAGEPGAKDANTVAPEEEINSTEDTKTTAGNTTAATTANNSNTVTGLSEKTITVAPAPVGQAETTPPTARDKDRVAAQAAAKRFSPTKEELGWMEDFALHNKQPRKRWKGKLDWQVYASGGFTYRTLFDKNEYPVNNTANTPLNRINMNGSVSHKPGLHLQAGAAVLYSLSRNLRFKTGLQLDYTNYYIYAYETTHPISTTLTLTDINTGIPIRHPRSSSLFNANGDGDAILNSSTYQLSVPVGLDLKLAGSDRLKWYAGATIQPTILLGSRSFLLSSDHQNYIAENSLARKFNLNAGIETFASYKTGNYTLQFGPQVRYQLLSTNIQRYTTVEKLFSYGVKFGFIKAF